MLHGLYVITDNKYYPLSTWPDRVEQIAAAGANIIQLRDKQNSDGELLPIANVIQEICKFYNTLFIVNDRISLAKQLQADGVHLGKDDQQIRAARNYLGNQFLVGASCYKSIYSAIQAQQQGADYVAFGSIFPSLTKQFAPRCSLMTIRKAKNILNIAVCAIGGIKLANVKLVLEMGADMVAISHAIFNDAQPEFSTNKFIQTIYD